MASIIHLDIVLHKVVYSTAVLYLNLESLAIIPTSHCHKKQCLWYLIAHFQATHLFETKVQVNLPNAEADDFYEQLTSKSKPKYILIAFVMALAGISILAYTQVFDKSLFQVSQSDIRDELEFNIRYNLFKENIEKLIAKPSFSAEWQDNVWSEMQGTIEILAGEPDEWFTTINS